MHDLNPHEDRDEDARRDAIDDRRRYRWQGCLCGYPDMPGTCPGAASCPMHGENLTKEDK